jgi:hypothetical protein
MGGVVFKLLFLMLAVFAACKKKNKDNPGTVPEPPIEIATITWDGKEITPNTTGTKENPFMVSSAEVATRIAYTLKNGTAGTADLKTEGNLYTFTAVQGTTTKVFYLQWTSLDKDVAVQVKYNDEPINLSGTNNDTYNINLEGCDVGNFDNTKLQRTSTATLSALTQVENNKWTFIATPQAGENYAKTYTITYQTTVPENCTNTAVRVTYDNIPVTIGENDTYNIQEAEASCGAGFDNTKLQITRADDGTLIPFSALTTNVANKWTFSVKPQTGDAKVYTLTYTLTVPDGYTLICTAADLKAIKNNLAGKYIQGADIDLTNLADFEPIGKDEGNAFTGTYDGQGYKIIDLKVDANKRGKYQYAGLFGYASQATLQNIALDGGSVYSSSSSSSYAGGLVGNADNTTISNSYATGAVSSYADAAYADAVYTGGLVGYANNTTISNSYATGSVSSFAATLYCSSYAGGLVGWANNASITNSYATGNVSSYADAGYDAASSYAGGLVGWANNASITNSYATGNVYSYGVGAGGSSSLAGGLVGLAVSGTITNCFQTDKQVTQNGSLLDGNLPAGVTRISAAGQAQNAFAGWNFGTVWATFAGNGWPTLLNVGVKP